MNPVILFGRWYPVAGIIYRNTWKQFLNEWHGNTSTRNVVMWHDICCIHLTLLAAVS